MTFREMIELYKQDKLTDEQKAELEREIEKHEAISEYLLETTSGFGDDADFDLDEGKAIDPETKAFAGSLKKSARKKFIAAGIITGAVVLVLTVFITAFLPPFADLFYYDPAATVKGDGISPTNQLTVDIAAYSELFLPGRYRDLAIADSRGWGDYDINILQSSSITGSFSNVSGKIEKNKLTLYDANYLTLPAGNCFDKRAQSASQMLELLDSLPDGYYTAFVTLTDDMGIDEFLTYYKYMNILPSLVSDGIWCSVKQEGVPGINMGFMLNCSYSEMSCNTEKYPYLSQFDLGMSAENDGSDDHIPSPEKITAHFTSLLRYLADQDAFCQMMGCDEIDFDSLAGDVNNNGMVIQGFAVTARRSELEKLTKLHGISHLFIAPAN